MIDQEIILGICWIQTCATDWQARDFIIRTEFIHKILHTYSHMFLEHLPRREKAILRDIAIERTLQLGHIRPMIHPEYFVQILESMVYYEYSKLTMPPGNLALLREAESGRTSSMSSTGTYAPSTSSLSREPSSLSCEEDTNDSVSSARENDFDYLIRDTRPSPSYSSTPPF
jgi:hypothetical protein